MRYLILLSALLCASCSSSLPSIKPFKMDIQQGNVVTSKMMLQLRPGMTKSQVRFIMGTPLIQDTFHADRWDYFYQMRKGGKIIEQRRVILDFNKDLLAKVRGDVIAQGSDEAKALPPEEPSKLSPAKQPEKEKSLLDKLKFWKGDEKPETKPEPVPNELVSPEQQPAPVAPAKQVPAKAPPAAPEPATTEPVAPQPATPLVAPVKEPEMATPAPQPEPSPEPAPVAKPKAAEPVAPQPEPAPAVVEPAKPVEKAPESKPAIKPVAKPAPQPEVKPKAAPEPTPVSDKDLPPEDDPSFFERMLEKIGF